MSPTKEGKTRPLQRHSSGCLVNTKMTSLDHCNSSLGERIDPTMPLESQLWVKSFCCIIINFKYTFLTFSSFVHLLSHFYFLVVNIAGTMERSAGQMQSLCSGCARRPATWWETAKPARTTIPSPSSKKNTLFSLITCHKPCHQIRAKVLMTAGWKSNANTPYDLACQVSECLQGFFAVVFLCTQESRSICTGNSQCLKTHTHTDHGM